MTGHGDQLGSISNRRGTELAGDTAEPKKYQDLRETLKALLTKHFVGCFSSMHPCRCFPRNQGGCWKHGRPINPVCSLESRGLCFPFWGHLSELLFGQDEVERKHRETRFRASLGFWQKEGPMPFVPRPQLKVDIALRRSGACAFI